MSKKYDYLVVGAGLAGATFAYEATKRGKKVLVIDKRGHLGGNIYTQSIENISVHKYGPHIFHTNNKYIWEYVNNFVEFNNFINQPLANYKGKLYSLPFNMYTFEKVFGCTEPEVAKNVIDEEIEQSGIGVPVNLEEQAIKMVGSTIYYMFIKEYTEKQWQRDCRELPPGIIKRLPVRYTFDNNYFNDRYQGIPVLGYTNMIMKMLKHSDVRVYTDFIKERRYYQDVADKIIYTGSIDEYYDYRFGILEYRSLEFETKYLDCKNFQGNAVINYTSKDVEWTRLIEHKHFQKSLKYEYTIITKEFSKEWNVGRERYYPINNKRNNELYEKYREFSETDEKVIFAGRLGKYKYYDMDKVIEDTLDIVDREFSES